MTIEQSIKKAIEGGYKSPNLIGTDLGYYNAVLLDPQFWQSLGISLNWKDKKSDPLMYEWLYQWHQFINHLATGKSIKEYFSKL